MKELIKKVTINGEEQMGVNARDLWSALQSKQQFSDWAKKRLADFEEGIDYTVHKIMNGENKGRFAANEYTLTLDTAKHLAMLERNEIGKQIRQYFIEVEKKYRKACHEATICDNHCEVVATDVDLTESTIELLDTLNRRILANIEVDKEVLRYAWNVGKLIERPIRKTLHEATPLEAYISQMPCGEYSREEVYSAYCSSCEHPVSARQFFPACRKLRRTRDRRTAYRRYIIIEE